MEYADRKAEYMARVVVIASSKLECGKPLSEEGVKEFMCEVFVGGRWWPHRAYYPPDEMHRMERTRIRPATAKTVGTTWNAAGPLKMAMRIVMARQSASMSSWL